MAWIYLAVTEDFHLPWHHGCDLSPTVKQTDTVNPNFFLAWSIGFCPMPPSGTTCELCKDGNFQERLKLSMAGFPVRISVLLEMEKAWQASEAAFLAKSSDWPKKQNPNSYSLKTSLQSEHADFRRLSENWPASGMTLDGVLYPLLKLVLPIGENDGSYWPTPTVHGNHQNKIVGGTHLKGLATVVAERQKWPTPTVRDSADKPLPDRKKTPKGAGKITGGQKPPLLSVIGGKLNPTWVEWLMGVPLGWTSLNPLMAYWLIKMKAENLRNKKQKKSSKKDFDLNA